MTLITKKEVPVGTSFLFLQLFFCFLQCSSKLIRAGGGLHAAVDTFHALDDLIHVHAFYQSADTLQVAVAAT